MEVELDRARNVGRVDRVPQPAEVEQVARGDERPGDGGEIDAELLGQLERQRQPAAIDDRVGELGRDQLAAQAVGVDRGGERSCIACGKAAWSDGTSSGSSTTSLATTAS